jgi:hypothetical protein
MDLEISKWSGRLGNNIIQIANTIWLSNVKRAKIKNMPRHLILNTNHLIDKSKLSNNRRITNSRKRTVRTVRSTFYNKKDIYAALKINKEPSFQELCKIIKSQIPKLLDIDLEEIPVLSDETLVVHIRSGDCFEPNPHSAYVMPPVAFYTKCIDKHIQNTPTTNIIIVTEPDYRNPGVNSIKTHVKTKHPDVIVNIQSTSVKNDAITILTAKHLLLSVGSFGFVFGISNPHLTTMYVSNYMIRYDELKQLNLCKCYIIDNYIEHNNWKGTDKQIELLKNLSLDNVIRDVL